MLLFEHSPFLAEEESEEQKLKKEIESLRYQLKQEKSETSAVFWIIFVLGFGYGFYADPSIYRFTHNVGNLMAPLVGVAAVASSIRATGGNIVQGIVAGIVFDVIVYAALYFLFR